MNELQTALTQSKRALRSTSYPFLFGGSFAISIMGTLMVMGYHPENIHAGFLSIFWFIVKGTISISALIISCGIIAIFVDTYRPRILKNYEEKRNYLKSVIDFFKNIRIFTVQHLKQREYHQILLENMLQNEKPSVWKWFGIIFVHTQKHITDQETINEKVEKRLNEHDSQIKEILKKKDTVIDSKNKKILRLQKIIEMYQKKYPLDKTFQSDTQDD